MQYPVRLEASRKARHIVSHISGLPIYERHYHGKCHCKCPDKIYVTIKSLKKPQSTIMLDASLRAIFDYISPEYFHFQLVSEREWVFASWWKDLSISDILRMMYLGDDLGRVPRMRLEKKGLSVSQIARAEKACLAGMKLL